MTARTCKGIALELQGLQVAQPPDRRRDDACTQERARNIPLVSPFFFRLLSAPLCVGTGDTRARTLEAHVEEPKLGNFREHRDVIRDGAAELVVAEVEDLELRRERYKQPQSLVERRPCA